MRHRDPEHAILLGQAQGFDQAPGMEVAEADRDVEGIDRLRDRAAIHVIDDEADSRDAPGVGADIPDDAAVIAGSQP
jgi:hypothetical protein